MDRLLRVSDICGDKRTNTPALIPIARSSWWLGVKKGKFPQPVKLGSGITAWRYSDIKKFMEGLQTNEPQLKSESKPSLLSTEPTSEPLEIKLSIGNVRSYKVAQIAHQALTSVEWIISHHCKDIGAKSFSDQKEFRKQCEAFYFLIESGAIKRQDVVSDCTQYRVEYSLSQKDAPQII